MAALYQQSLTFNVCITSAVKYQIYLLTIKINILAP